MREAVQFTVYIFIMPLNCVSRRSVAVIFCTQGTNEDGSVDPRAWTWWTGPAVYGGMTLTFSISLASKAISVEESRVSTISDVYETSCNVCMLSNILF